MKYPAPIEISQVVTGQTLYLLMLYSGKERAGHGDSVEDWIVTATVKSIAEGILTVSIDDTAQEVSFYIYNRFHEVGKGKSDYRPFLQLKDAYAYEDCSRRNREYHSIHIKRA